MARSGRRRVSIKQVAEQAGVSVQTVSRVLNDRPDVAAETRRRVKEIIARLGYQPSRIARSLSQGRSSTLGIVGTGLEYFGPSRTLVGIVDQANTLGYTLYFNLTHQPEGNDVEDLLQSMYAQHVEGIIWAVPEIGANREWIRQRGARFPVPVVFLSMQPQPNLSSVCVDNRAGARLATQHLVEQGYSRIGLITGPLTWWEARQRQDGWQDTLAQAGLPTDPRWVTEGDWSAGSGEQALLELHQRAPEIDALFVSNDQMALGVLMAARQLGLRVPEDLAIVSFDDIPEAAYFCPPLTTVRQDMIDLGSCAVAELDRLIRLGRQGEEAGARSIFLQPQLIVRASSVASPASGDDVSPGEPEAAPPPSSVQRG